MDSQSAARGFSCSRNITAPIRPPTESRAQSIVDLSFLRDHGDNSVVFVGGGDITAHLRQIEEVIVMPVVGIGILDHPLGEEFVPRVHAMFRNIPAMQLSLMASVPTCDLSIADYVTGSVSPFFTKRAYNVPRKEQWKNNRLFLAQQIRRTPTRRGS